LNTGHAYGAIYDVMEIMEMGKKGKYLNTLEKYHIYRTSKENMHLNDISTEVYNPIYEELKYIRKNTRNTIQTPPTPTPHGHRTYKYERR
jgi:hypothetical protein